MKATQIAKILHKLVDEKIATFIWGAPGVGKSSVVKEIAAQKEIGFIDLRLSLLDPTDLKGIPFYDKESRRALWAPPAFLPQNGEGILFLDELNTASPSLQASAYQLILDRAIGEYRLPEGWAVVAAGNREGDRGVVYKMASPLANRFIHLELDVDIDDWRYWAYENGIDDSIIAYIGYKNEHLFTFDPKSGERSFATPRSWEFVDKILKSDLDRTLLLETISGAVSKEVAVSFLGFAKVHADLPDIEMILQGKSKEYPTRIDVLYVLASVLVSRYLALRDEQTLENIIDYTLSLESEFAVMIVQDLQRVGVDMLTSDSFRRWSKKFSHLL